MIAKTLNCKYLQINSSVYEELVLAGKLASLKIKGKINQGTSFEETLEYPLFQQMWGVDGIPIGSDVSIVAYNVINIFTGQVINIMTAPYTVSTVNAVTGFKDIIAARFLALFNKVITQQSQITYDIEAVPVSFRYRIFSLPYYLKPYSIQSNHSGVVTEVFFISTTSGVGVPEEPPVDGVVNLPESISLDQNTIVLLPSFFDLEAYSDSIVHLELTLTHEDGSFTTEEVCYFMDCTIKCKLTSMHNFECLNQGMNLAMLHYSLTQASNCNCDCANMYEIFQYLDKQLTYITNNIEGCGC